MLDCWRKTIRTNSRLIVPLCHTGKGATPRHDLLETIHVNGLSLPGLRHLTVASSSALRQFPLIGSAINRKAESRMAATSIETAKVTGLLGIDHGT